MTSFSLVKESVEELVESIRAYGEAENIRVHHGKKSNYRDERVAFSKEKVETEVHRLLELIKSDKRYMDLAKRLLMSHMFNTYSNEQLDETQKTVMFRLRYLNQVLNGELRQDIDLEKGLFSGQAQFQEEEQKLSKGILSPRSERASGGLVRGAHAKNMLQGLSLTSFDSQFQQAGTILILAKRNLRVVMRAFSEWKFLVINKKRSCATIVHYMKLAHQKQKARAFAKLGRHALFSKVISIAARESCPSMPTQRPRKPPQPQNRRKPPPNSTTTDRGRKLPWEP